jgi:Domain of unknown function (DUF4470)
MQLFCPIRIKSAISLTQDLPPEKDANILLLGDGDLGNVLFTLFYEQNYGNCESIWL